MRLKEYLARKLVASGYSRNRPSIHVRGAKPVWLDEAHWSRLLCFVHIPKCAGTSFNDALWNVYGKSFLTYHPRFSSYHPPDITPDQAKDILAISGHLAYGFHRDFGSKDEDVFADREVFYVSTVRDPVDRLLSLARFVRSFPSHRLYEATKHMSCAQFFEYAVTNKGAGILGNRQSDLLTDKRPDQAIEYARTRYLAVATVESAPALIQAVSEHLHWPEIHLSHKNKSPKRLTSDEDRDLARRLCEQYCQHDMALYEYVSAQPRGLVI